MDTPTHYSQWNSCCLFKLSRFTGTWNLALSLYKLLDTVLNRFRSNSISCCLLYHMNIVYRSTKLFQNDNVTDFKVSQMKRTFMDNIHKDSYIKPQFSSVAQSCLTIATPWTAACQTSLSTTDSQNLLKLMSIAAMMPSDHLITCRRLLLLPSIFSSMRVFSNGKFFASDGQSIGVSASASVLPMNTQDWSPLGWTGGISLQSKGLSRVFSNTIVQRHQFFGTYFLHSPTHTSIHNYWKNHRLWLDRSLKSHYILFMKHLFILCTYF